MKKKVLIILCCIVCFVTGCTILSTRSKPTEQPGDSTGSGFNSIINAIKPEPEEPKIINIALFGIDTGREKNEAAHSDTIMILSIDEIHKKIKISSFLRDTYVYVEGHGNTKINTAYAYGGPELAIKTINQNFDMDIEDYITVDFVGLSDIIDTLGGVEVPVKENEIKEINKYTKEIGVIKKEKPTLLKEAGIQLLDGIQATAYARIRKVGDGDFERTERQRNVLFAIFSKIKQQNITKYPAIAASLIPYVKTSMSFTEILGTGRDIIKQGIANLDWYRFPLLGYCKGEMIRKTWYLITDLKVTTDHLHQFIYEDVKVPQLKDSF